MPSTFTPEENREGRNRERLKSALASLVRDMITEDEQTIERYEALRSRLDTTILNGQINHSKGMITALLKILGRLHPRTARQVPKEL